MTKENLITLQFLLCTPMRLFAWKLNEEDGNQLLDDDFCSMHTQMKHKAWSDVCQSSILNDTFLHLITKKYPPARKFQKSFLKSVINQVESVGETCIEDICDLYIELLHDVQESVSYKSYYVPSSNMFITLQESTNLISNGTTGLVTWTGGLALAEWCLMNEEELINKDILELGSGCGIVGLVVSKSIHIKSFNFTDVHSEVLERLRHNVNINGLNDEEHPVTYLNWGKPFIEDTKPNVILAADVVFDPEVVPLLVKTLADFLGRSASFAVVATTLRNEKTYLVFLSQLDAMGLKQQEIKRNKFGNVFLFERNADIRILKIWC